MKRAAALVASLLIIIGAVLFTQSRDPDSGDSGTGSDGSLRLACAAELAELCTQLAGDADDVVITTEAAPDTIAQWSSGGGPDGWLVPTPWPALATERVSTGGGTLELYGADDPLAQRSLDLVITDAWRGALDNVCGGAISWSCVVDSVGRSAADLGSNAGGTFKLGVSRPTVTDGVVGIGALVEGWFGSPEHLVENWDGFDLDETFSSQLFALKRNAGSDQDALNTLIIKRGTYGAVLALGGAQRLAALDRGDLTSRNAVTMVPNASSLVLVGTSERARGDLAKRIDLDKVTDWALANGWSAPTGDATSGLPAPNLIDLLITKWTSS